MKVVIDTNIWISYLLGNLLQGLDKKIILKEIKIVASEKLLNELSEVIRRPKFRKNFTPKRIKELFALLDNYSLIVSPNQKIDNCRDAKDNFLLELALEGKVDYLVTGDKDLLVLNPFHSINIINPKDFSNIIKK